jgi:hypothetical protein
MLSPSPNPAVNSNRHHTFVALRLAPSWPAPAPRPKRASCHVRYWFRYPAELVAFAHAALFSPAPSTLAIALKKGFVQNFPGLTEKALTKYLPRLYAHHGGIYYGSG